MKKTIPGMMLITVLLLPPAALQGALRGDTGWSDDGQRYGFCDPAVMPDAPAGCVFFDRNTLEWVETGRREAMRIWRPWAPAPEASFPKPLTPVYPLDEKDRGSGIVRLEGRLAGTNDVVELWKSRNVEGPDAKGSAWETVFEYSPDGTWLAAGALRVDFTDSRNVLHVIVRPTSHWVVLAGLRAGLSKLSEGRLTQGLSRLFRAGSHFEKLMKKKEKAPPEPPDPERTFRSRVAEDAYVEGSWTEKMAVLRWSGDGKTLCACDAWVGHDGRRASCRYYETAAGEWQPVVAEKIRYLCPAPEGEPVEERHAAFLGSYWADWAWKETTGSYHVAVYRTDTESGIPAAVMRKEIKWEPPHGRTEGSTELLFHAVELPSPSKKLVAAGFAAETSDHTALRFHVEVAAAAWWKKKAEEDLEAYEPAAPEVVETIPGLD